MIGSLIGAGISAAGSIFGGIQASKAMKQVKSNIQDQRNKNQNWYDRRYNEDATQRADAQAVINKTEESIRERNRQAAGAQAVMGGTQESVAAAKAANNAALASTMSNIAAEGDRRKDAIESQYMERDNALQGQLNQMEINKAGAITQAVKGLTGAASSLGTSVDDYIDSVRAEKAAQS